MNNLDTWDAIESLAWDDQPLVVEAPPEPVEAEPTVMLPPLLDADGYRWAPFA